MVVILDTCCIMPEFWFVDGVPNKLLEKAEQLGYTFALPEIVLQELVANFRDKLDSAKKKHSEFNSLARLEDVDYESLIHQRTEEYDKILRKVFDERENERKVLPLPKVKHQDVIKRICDRRKPFRHEGDKGYKDFLLWRTIVAVAKVEQVCFVSENTADFGDRNQLLTDYRDDLRRAGIPTERVLYYSSPKDFYDIECKPKLDRLREIEEGVSEGKVGSFDLEKWLLQMGPQLYEDVKLNPTYFFDEEWLTSATVIHTGIPEGFNSDSAYRLDDQLVWIDIAFRQALTIKAVGRIPDGPVEGWASYEEDSFELDILMRVFFDEVAQTISNFAIQLVEHSPKDS